MISLETRRYLVRQVIECIAFMHNVNGLAHLDIKPENFVVNDDYSISLIDFGFIAPKDERINTGEGSTGYMAPEIYDCRKYGDEIKYIAEKADLYALGRLIQAFVIYRNPTFSWSNHPELGNLMVRLLNRDPLRR